MRKKVVVEKEKHPVRCECGKLIAYRQGNTLLLYCKQCKRQIPVLLEPEP